MHYLHLSLPNKFILTSPFELFRIDITLTLYWIKILSPKDPVFTRWNVHIIFAILNHYDSKKSISSTSDFIESSVSILYRLLYSVYDFRIIRTTAVYSQSNLMATMVVWEKGSKQVVPIYEFSNSWLTWFSM